MVFDFLFPGDSSSYILLEFQQMHTECSYDYLFVYNGQSYQSPLLGSFSGDSIPNPVMATSGYVSIDSFLDFTHY